jgi:uncharacterized damage-inducible protein DinB
MGPKDVLRTLVRTNDHILNAYLGDLADNELLERPVPGANHIAWQLGHLINSEQSLLNYVAGAKGIDLPAGFGDQYTPETSRADKPDGYLTKAQYLELHKKSRENILKVIDAVSDADLDKATEGRMASFAPTLGAMLVLIANHPMMHLGQFAVVRRKLGKPVTI